MPANEKPEHTVWIEGRDFRRLRVAERVRVSFHYSTRRPAVGDRVEVRESGVYARDASHHARLGCKAVVVAVEDDDAVTTTLERGD